MAGVSTDILHEILVNVASVLNLEDWEHSQLKFECIGQNFFGVLIPIELTGKNKGEETRVRLVLKLAPTEENYRVSGAVTLFFAREIFVYSTLIKEFLVSQQNSALPQFVAPVCYYVCRSYCREVLALQDMTSEGYTPYTRGLFLDFQHLVVSLKSLAIFHAHSFIFRYRNNELYVEATKECVPLTLQSNKRYMEVLEDRLTKAMWVFENSTHAIIFKNLRKHQVKLVEAAWDSVNETCICHGDIWKENILFKYEKGEPVSACLIDYQTARVSSPAYDVVYLVTSSAGSGVRRPHFRNLINVYYEQFAQVLKQAGLESDNLYDRESFESDLKTVAPACVIAANTALWLASGCQQEGHVRSKRVLNTEEERRAAIERYKKIMSDVVDDFLSYDYLSLCNY